MRPFDKDPPMDMGSKNTQILLWSILKRYAKKEGLPLDASGFKRFVGNLAKELGIVSNSRQNPALYTIMFTLLEDLVADMSVDLRGQMQMPPNPAGCGPELKRQNQNNH